MLLLGSKTPSDDEQRAVLNRNPREPKSSEPKETFILVPVGSRTCFVTDGPCLPSDIFSSINLRHVCVQLSFILCLRTTTRQHLNSFHWNKSSSARTSRYTFVASTRESILAWLKHLISTHSEALQFDKNNDNYLMQAVWIFTATTWSCLTVNEQDVVLSQKETAAADGTVEHVQVQMEGRVYSRTLYTTV